MNGGRILVIGGGVSGATAAIRLRHHGYDVTLVERATFPREKICGCCLGAAGLSALDAIGLGAGVRNLGVPTRRFVAYLQTRQTTIADEIACGAPIELEITPGVAISRGVLDSYLLEQAEAIGVRVQFSSEAQVVNADASAGWARDRRVGAKWNSPIRYDLVVVATGLSGNFQARTRLSESSSHESSGRAPVKWELPWVEAPNGPLGAGTLLPHDDLIAKQWPLPVGDIQMICGDDGYVGLVRLPDGSIDIAAALRSGRQAATKESYGIPDQPSRRIARLLSSHPDIQTGHPDMQTRHPNMQTGLMDAMRCWLQDRARWMTAPPLRRRRQSGRGRVVAIGDCGGYIEPLTGEGMTWGIESGIAVADLWNDINGAASNDESIDFARYWQSRARGLQPKRRWLCGSITRGMRSRSFRNLTQHGLRHCNWLARPITRGLACGPTFPNTVATTTT